jgi:hypothetical protein
MLKHNYIFTKYINTLISCRSAYVLTVGKFNILFVTNFNNAMCKLPLHLVSLSNQER